MFSEHREKKLMQRALDLRFNNFAERILYRLEEYGEWVDETFGREGKLYVQEGEDVEL